MELYKSCQLMAFNSSNWNGMHICCISVHGYKIGSVGNVYRTSRITAITEIPKRKKYIYTHIQKLKRSKNSKTFVEESELVAIDQSEVILRKIYSISLQTTHSPQTCMHSFLTKVQCSTLKIKEWPSKFQYSTTYQNILSNMPIAQPLLLA